MTEATMSRIDYFFTPTSPWTYLGAERFIDMARRHKASVRLLPADFGPIMAQSGGLPLGKRAKQRQAYRLQELARWKDHLGSDIVIEPKFFPVPPHLAAQAIIAVDATGGDGLGFSLAVGRAIWVEEQDISDPETLRAIADAFGLDGQAIVASAHEQKPIYDANTQEAIDRGVFGAPTYLIGDQMFWGQDRLMFLEQALSR